VVFQNHSLLPWLTAFENVEIAVEQVFGREKSKREMQEWIEYSLQLVHMDHAMHKRPDEISGGMKQRKVETLKTERRVARPRFARAGGDASHSPPHGYDSGIDASITCSRRGGLPCSKVVIVSSTALRTC
jgi:hypothetical protein